MGMKTTGEVERGPLSVKDGWGLQLGWKFHGDRDLIGLFTFLLLLNFFLLPAHVVSSVDTSAYGRSFLLFPKLFLGRY